MPTDEIASLVKSADPVPTLPITATELHSTLVRELISTERTSAARVRAAKRRRRISVAAVAACLAVPTTAWAAHHFAAQSGWFGAPGMTENDTSEWINVCATDFPQYLSTLPHPSDAPPSGHTWSEIGQEIAQQKQKANTDGCPTTGPGGVMEQRTGLIAAYYMWAENTWTCRAVRDHNAGDSAGFRENAGRAADMMERIDGLKVWGDENWKPVRDALRDGDFARVNSFYAANNPHSGTCK